MESSTFLMQAQNVLAASGKPPAIGRPASMEEARKVAQDFEAFFLGQAFQPLFANIKAEEPFGGGQAEDMWRSLQVDEYGKAVARAGGVGIADAVMEQILRLQEVE